MTVSLPNYLIARPNRVQWAECEGAPTPLASLTNDDGGASTMAKPKPIRPDLTAEYLRSILDYDQESGVFVWRERPDMRPMWNSRYAGKRAGFAWTVNPGCVYWSIRIHDWPFLAHRLAWLYVYGEWPNGQVDHIDGDGLNNRIANLRLATKSQNAANARRPRTNKSGYKGVCLVTGRTDKWRATIKAGGRQVHLGHFSDPREAHAAYCEAARKLHGEFARPE